MFQHRWALWSGILGATASCLAKIALSTQQQEDFDNNYQFNPMGQLESSCQDWLTVDLDDVGSKFVYRILGDLMIKHRINVMPQFLAFRRDVIEEGILYFHVFEVDWCRVLVALGPRLLCFVSMLLLNAYMLATFLKGMQASGSVVGTAISTGANFSMSAMYGYVLWHERFPKEWWMGFSYVVMGVLMLSTVQSDKDDTSSKTNNKTYSPFPPRISPPKPKKPASKLRQYGSASKSIFTISKRKKQLVSKTVDRTFANECPLCEAQLFDESTGEALMAIADLSPNCYHVAHAKCLKNQQSQSPKSGSSADNSCPVCDKPVHMWISSKQAAHFAGFWVDRVETILQQVGPNKDKKGAPQPISAEIVRERLRHDETLCDSQKEYINGDPTGLGKGLQSALEWGGSVDYNQGKKGHVGWSQALLTRGIWSYDVKKDELWLWEWNAVHPKQRCEQCQFLKQQLPIACAGCQGSSEQAFYCNESCQKRDWQRHKMTCELWQNHGANAKK